MSTRTFPNVHPSLSQKERLQSTAILAPQGEPAKYTIKGIKMAVLSTV